MATRLVPVRPDDVLTQAPPGFFAPAPAGHFWLEHLVRVLATVPQTHLEWKLLTLSEPGQELTALYAVNTRTGYCMFHALEPTVGGRLLTEGIDRYPSDKVLGNYGALESAVEAAGLEHRITRDHREMFLILPCGGLSFQPDWDYRIAGPQDIPRLLEYNTLYNTERETHWKRDWTAVIKERIVYVRERDGVIASCLMRGAALPPLVSFGGTFTFPEFRGKGDGTMLVANFCAEMALSHFDICLIVDDDNLPAMRTYSKVGFVPTGLYRTTYFR